KFSGSHLHTLTQTHTQTRAHTRTHARTHKHTHSRTHTQAQTHTHARTHTHTHTHTQTHTHRGRARERVSADLIVHICHGEKRPSVSWSAVDGISYNSWGASKSAVRGNLS